MKAIGTGCEEHAFKSRRWWDGEGLRERLNGLLGAIGNRGLSPIVLSVVTILASASSSAASDSVEQLCRGDDQYLSLHFVPVTGISPLFVCDRGKLFDPNAWIKKHGVGKFQRLFGLRDYCYKTGDDSEHFTFNEAKKDSHSGRVILEQCVNGHCLNVLYMGLGTSAVAPDVIGEKPQATKISAHMQSAARPGCDENYHQKHEAADLTGLISKAGYTALKHALSKFSGVSPPDIRVGQQYGYVNGEFRALIGSSFGAGPSRRSNRANGMFLFDGKSILDAIAFPQKQHKCIPEVPCPIVRISSLIGENDTGFLVSTTMIYMTDRLDDEFQSGEEIDVIYRFDIGTKRWTEIRRFNPVKQTYQFLDAFN